jgi:hypothetical protein
VNKLIEVVSCFLSVLTSRGVNNDNTLHVELVTNVDATKVMYISESLVGHSLKAQYNKGYTSCVASADISLISRSPVTSMPSASS